MKKIVLGILVLISFSQVNAQSGNNGLGVGLDLGLPLGDFGDAAKLGIGGSVKFLYGVGTSGQLTLTSGYTTFKAKDIPSGYDASSSIIPILAGYRHNLGGLYLEPQLGYGIYGSKFSYQNVSESSSDGAFTWAVGAGYAMTPGVDVGVRFQSATKEGEALNLLGIALRYVIGLGQSSK